MTFASEDDVESGDVANGRSCCACGLVSIERGEALSLLLVALGPFSLLLSKFDDEEDWDEGDDDGSAAVCAITCP